MTDESNEQKCTDCGRYPGEHRHPQGGSEGRVLHQGGHYPVNGQNNLHTIYGRIPISSQRAAHVGSYSDTITLTVSCFIVYIADRQQSFPDLQSLAD